MRDNDSCDDEMCRCVDNRLGMISYWGFSLQGFKERPYTGLIGKVNIISNLYSCAYRMIIERIGADKNHLLCISLGQLGLVCTSFLK